MKFTYAIISVLFIALINNYVKGRQIANIHSDVIVTKWPEPKPGKSILNGNVEVSAQSEKQGWMKRQLVKFGKVIGKVGNSMGAQVSKVALTIDKICEIVKTIIPVIAAVCHVGQFKFCETTSGSNLSSVDVPPEILNLNEPDK